MEGLPFAIVMCNSEGVIESTSIEAEVVLGQPESLLVGKKIYEIGFISYDEYTSIRKDYYDSSDDTFNFYFDDRYLEIEFASIETATGALPSPKEVFILRDGSNINNIDRLLFDSNTQKSINQIQQLSNTGYCIFNIKNSTLTFSKSAMRMLRISNQSNLFDVHTFMNSYLTKVSQERLFRTIQYSIEQKSEFQTEIDFIRENGVIRHIRINAKNNYGKEREGISILGVLTDITEFREHEIAHAEYIAITDSILETVNSGIVIFDFNDNVRTYNIVLLELLKLTGTKLIGLSIGEFAELLDQELSTNGYFQKMAPFILKQKGIGIKRTFVTKDGKTIEIAVNRSDSFDERQTTVCLFTDISERIKTQNQLVTYNRNLKFAVANLEDTVTNMQEARQIAEEAKTMQNLFVSNITHDMRSPINTILGFTDMLEASGLDDIQKQYLDTIRKRCYDQLFLINDIHALSSINSGKMQIHYKQFDFIEMLNDIKQSIEIKIKSGKVDFELTMPDDFPAKINQDENRIRQIINNLLDNAAKFTQEGKISLDTYIEKCQTKDERKDIIITISDTGIGIPQEEQQAIFNPFVQVKGQNRKFGGSGLGLAIVKDLVEILNGEISLESQEGIGSKFTVVLKEVETSGTAEKIHFCKDDHAIKGTKIIIITDENDTSKFNFLKTLGADIHIVHKNDTLQRVKVIIDFKPDIIIEEIKLESDINLEYIININGKSKVNLGIPIIALTDLEQSNTNRKLNAYYDKVLPLNIEKDKIITSISRLKGGDGVYFRKDADYTIDNIIVSLTEEQKKYIQENIEHLKASADSASDSFILSQFSAFATELREFGQRAKVEYIVSLSERLIRALDNYNIDVLLEITEDIKVLISKLAKEG